MNSVLNTENTIRAQGVSNATISKALQNLHNPQGVINVIQIIILNAWWPGVRTVLFVTITRRSQCLGVAGTSQMLVATAMVGCSRDFTLPLLGSLCAAPVVASDNCSACGPGFAFVVPNGMTPVLLQTGNLAPLGDLGTIGATLA